MSKTPIMDFLNACTTFVQLCKEIETLASKFEAAASPEWKWMSANRMEWRIPFVSP